jgi:hypothetical protein
MGFGPFDPTGPPGSVKSDRLGSGSVNRPNPAPSFSLSPPRALWRTLSRRRHRPANPAISGGLRRRCLGQVAAPAPSTTNSKWNRRKLPLRGDLGWFLLGTRRRWSPLICYLAEPSLLLVVPPPVLVMREYSPVEAPWCGALGVRSVKSSPGSLWPAAQALPCHAVQTSTWATVSVISSPSNLLLLIWPRSLAI